MLLLASYRSAHCSMGGVKEKRFISVAYLNEGKSADFTSRAASSSTAQSVAKGKPVIQTVRDLVWCARELALAFGHVEIARN